MNLVFWNHFLSHFLRTIWIFFRWTVYSYYGCAAILLASYSKQAVKRIYYTFFLTWKNRTFTDISNNRDPLSFIGYIVLHISKIMLLIMNFNMQNFIYQTLSVSNLTTFIYFLLVSDNPKIPNSPNNNGRKDTIHPIL